MQYIDLNCDMGEGVGNDAEIMPFISAANIACGYHAGDEETMQQTIALAVKNNVAVGAHPGFDDKENFGRANIQLSYTEVYELVLKQVQVIQSIAAKNNVKLHHVKPHGALYNMAAKNMVMAAAIAQAVKQADETLVLYGLYNSHLISEAKKNGLQTASEVFADRRYNNDGSLVARTNPGALIDDDEEAIQQVLSMVKYGKVTAVDRMTVPVMSQTICIHGDGMHAVAFAKKIHGALAAANIIIKTV